MVVLKVSVKLLRVPKSQLYKRKGLLLKAKTLVLHVFIHFLLFLFFSPRMSSPIGATILLAWNCLQCLGPLWTKISLHIFFTASLIIPLRFSLQTRYFHSCNKCEQGFLYGSGLIFLPPVSYLILIFSYSRHIGIEIITSSIQYQINVNKQRGMKNMEKFNQ